MPKLREAIRVFRGADSRVGGVGDHVHILAALSKEGFPWPNWSSWTRKRRCIGGRAFLTSPMTEQPGYIQHMVNQHKPHQDQVSPQSYEGDPNAQGHLHGRQMVRFAFLLRKII
jgi:hypothetical protein